MVGTDGYSSDDLFNEFIRNYRNICPSGRLIRYINGKVECSVHNEANGNEDDGNQEEPAPFL
jgi:hypothetical protein